MFWNRISSWIWISSQLEDRNSKYFEAEYRPGFEFRASSKIEIHYLTIYFEYRAISEIDIQNVLRQIASWIWIKSQLDIEIKNV